MRAIDGDALQADLRESDNELRKIYNELTHEEDRMICNVQLSTFFEVFMRIKEAPTLDVAPVSHGCEYCSGKRVEYQYTANTKLYINTFGKARTLEVECSSCPPYAECCVREIPSRSAFIINYCPNCGAKMGGDAE